MKRVFALIGALLVFAFPSFGNAASPLPAPTNYINDYAGVLVESDESLLNAKLKAYEGATTNQIFVAIVKDLGGQDIESYAGDVFEGWKIGQKGKDNGILILTSIGDDIRRIEVGYGLEGEITDGQAGTIIRSTLKPLFQQKKYAEGLTNTIDLIEQEISGQIHTEDPDAAKKSDGWNSDWVIFLLIVGFQIIAGIGSWLAKSKSWWHGGILGGVIGITLGIAVGALLTGAIAVFVFALIGLLIDYFLSKTYRPGSFKRKYDSPWFWGGGGGFGGGGFGGGFGGGGGGGSGGGGASG